MKDIEDKYRVKDSYKKRVLNSMPAFFKHYWLNTKWLIGFSVAALICFVYFLHVDREPFWFWVCTGFVVFINLVRFFGLLLKWRP